MTTCHVPLARQMCIQLYHCLLSCNGTIFKANIDVVHYEMFYESPKTSNQRKGYV